MRLKCGHVISKDALGSFYTFINPYRFHMIFKDSTDRSDLIFEINVGKSRIRHRTTPNLNDLKFKS